MSYLPTNVKGIWLYLYLVIDVWSRKIVDWDVEEKEDPKIAAKLVTRACLRERINRRQQPLFLHAGNGNIWPQASRRVKGRNAGGPIGRTGHISLLLTAMGKQRKSLLKIII
jgi:transposase InsO family protein